MHTHAIPPSDNISQNSTVPTINVNSDNELPTNSDTMINHTNVTNNSSDLEIVNRRNSEPANSSPVISEPNNINNSASGVIHNKLISFSEELDKIKTYMKQLDDRVKTLESQNSSDVQLAPTLESTSFEVPAPLTNLTQRLANIENSNLEHRITALESKLPNTGDNVSDYRSAINNNNRGKTTLFIGDTNLYNIKTTDLHKMCAIRTFRDSDTDLIKCWVEEKLSWVPEKCIIYSGLFDAKQSKTPSKVIDDLSALVSSLKVKNENMQIHIVQTAPSHKSDTLQAKLNEINDHIRNWASENDINTINPDPYL